MRNLLRRMEEERIAGARTGKAVQMFLPKLDDAKTSVMQLYDQMKKIRTDIEALIPDKDANEQAWSILNKVEHAAADLNDAQNALAAVHARSLR